MKKITLTFVALLLFLSYGVAQDLPSNPTPGKCYVKCITKDEFKEVEERIEVKPAYHKMVAVPAVYKTIEEKILIKQASKKFVYVPAVYKTVDVPYVKKEKSDYFRITKASFGNDVETLEIFPKTSGWEYKTLKDCPSANKEACVTACFVEYPARFKDVNIITLSQDAFGSKVPVEEQNGTYKKQVVATPARVDEIEIPAKYSTIKRVIVETPATTKKELVPAEYKTIRKKVLAKKGGITVWEEVDCKLLNPTLLPVFYELGSARLTPASKRTIDNLLLPLLEGKSTSVEIMSHTDSRGDDQYNLSLSQQRANSVVNYLVSKGIARSRMIAKGYGETRLINKCANGVKCSEYEHKRNRRTEFRILGNE